MFSLTQNVIILIVTMAASLLFMAGLNRAWPVAKRHELAGHDAWAPSVVLAASQAAA